MSYFTVFFLYIISSFFVKKQVVAQMFSPGAMSSVAGASGQYVMLTFDDGPHAVLTPKLLDILKEKNAKATFYVMGVKAALHPNILKRMVEEGHEVASHTWNHPIISKIPRENLHQQLARTNKAIKEATGEEPATFRPPYGIIYPTI